MKTYFYIVIILFISCNSDKQNEKADYQKEEVVDSIKETQINEKFVDSLYLITKCDTISLELLEISRKRKDLLTFQNQTYIYCSPSTESKIIDSLPSNMLVESWKPILRSYKPKDIERDGKRVTINKAKENWYEINKNGQKGYLFEKGLTLKKLRNNVLFGEKPNDYKYQLLSFDSKNKNMVIDSMELNRNHGYNIKWLNYNGLTSCTGVIRYHDFRQSCPGTSSISFIAINDKGEFKKLLSSFNGTESSSTIYFPLKFESGKTLLVADGNVEQIFNYYSGELNTFDYPEDTDVPINQLIIETKIVYAEDIEGLLEEEIEITKSDTTYYRWNGIELNKIKTTGNTVYK